MHRSWLLWTQPSYLAVHATPAEGDKGASLTDSILNTLLFPVRSRYGCKASKCMPRTHECRPLEVPKQPALHGVVASGASVFRPALTK